MEQTLAEVFTQEGRRTALLHDDTVALCMQTGQLEIRRRFQNPQDAVLNQGQPYEKLRFTGAAILTPDADETALLGVVSVLHGSERLRLRPDKADPNGFRVWKLVAVPARHL